MINETFTLILDGRGNVTLPNVGPVNLAGIRSADVNTKIQAAASTVYQTTVQVYATAVGVGEIKVFVTGPVTKPGSHSATSDDSVVTYLQRAGGVDADRGSYRHISVRRNNRVIAIADLYAFLLNGDLPDVTLRSGDTIVVGQQGPIVSVSGDARAPYTFEFYDTSGNGAELFRFARPRPEVTHVSILGTRDGKPFNAYVTRAEFESVQLMDGDRVRFEADAPSDTFIVRVEGANKGPSAYTVNRGDMLGSLIKQLQIDPLADQPMIHLRRVSVAENQRQLLQDSLDRLEKVVLTTPASSPAVAQARAAEADGLQKFIARARTVEPGGLVSLPDDADLDQVLLEPDDVIVIPFRTQTVSVGGEVEIPQTMLWTPGKSAKDYVTRAGGYGNRAKVSDTLIIHPDGSTQRGGIVRAGDRILVPPKVGGEILPLIKDLTQVLYQIGVAGLAVTRF
jgi:protein involved in polysaccharide export with SLBB domain